MLFSPFCTSALCRLDSPGVMRRVPIWSCLSCERMSLIRKAGWAVREVETRGSSRVVFFLGVFWRDLLFCRMFFIFLRRIFASPPLSPSSLSLLESSSSVVKSSGPRSSAIAPGEFSCYDYGQKGDCNIEMAELTKWEMDGKSSSVERYKYHCPVARSRIFCSISQNGQTLLSCSVFLTRPDFLFLKLSRSFLTACCARISSANIL